MNMADKIKTFLLVITAFITLGLGFHMIIQAEDSKYYTYGTVSAINGDNIQAIDSNGEIWNFSGDGYKEHQIIKMTMSNNMTAENKLDDIVLNVEILK